MRGLQFQIEFTDQAEGRIVICQSGAVVRHRTFESYREAVSIIDEMGGVPADVDAAATEALLRSMLELMDLKQQVGDDGDQWVAEG